jgi:hypothetical protein
MRGSRPCVLNYVTLSLLLASNGLRTGLEESSSCGIILCTVRKLRKTHLIDATSGPRLEREISRNRRAVPNH